MVASGQVAELGLDVEAAAPLAELVAAGAGEQELSTVAALGSAGLGGRMQQMAELQRFAPDRAAMGLFGALESAGIRGDAMKSVLVALSSPNAGAAQGSKERPRRLSADQLPFRAEMERAFGQSFADVGVIRGSGKSLKRMGARAAASRQGVMLPDGADRKLVAHELAHVVQARGAGPASGGFGQRGGGAEREADAAAEAVLRGERPAIHQRPDGAVMRKEDPAGSGQLEALEDWTSAMSPLENARIAWNGVDPSNGKKVSGKDRLLAMLSAASPPGVNIRTLSKLSEHYADEVEAGGKWVQKTLGPRAGWWADLVTDFVPIVSNVKDATLAITGVNAVTGEKVGPWGRTFAAVCAIPGLGNAVKWVGKGGGKLLKWGGKLLKSSDTLKRAFNWAKGLKGSVVKGLKNAGEWTANKLGRAGDWAAKKASGAWDRLAKKSSGAGDWISRKTSQASGWLSKKGGQASEWAGKKLGGAKDWAGQQVGRAVDSFRSRFPKAAKRLGDTLGPIKDWVVKKASSGKDWAAERLSKGGKWAGETLGAAKDWAAKKTGQAGDWLAKSGGQAKDWASQKLGDAGAWAKGKATSAGKLLKGGWDGVKNWWNGDSKSADRVKDAAETGVERLTGDELNNAEKEATGGDLDWVSPKLERAGNWAGGKVDAGRKYAGAKLTQAKDWAVKKGTAAKNTVVQKATQAKDWTVKKASAAKKAVVSTATQAKDWASQKVDSAKKWIGSLFD